MAREQESVWQVMEMERGVLPAERLSGNTHSLYIHTCLCNRHTHYLKERRITCSSFLTNLAAAEEKRGSSSLMNMKGEEREGEEVGTAAAAVAAAGEGVGVIEMEGMGKRW
jgi:hypothetical protein